MCGFTGFVQKNDFELTNIKAMSDKISHRGRDDESYCHFNITRKIFCKKNLLNQSPKNHILGSIGFKRLSIQDLTNQGRQPMHNNKKDISIIYNGEIYNKNKLEQKLTTELQRQCNSIKERWDTRELKHYHDLELPSRQRLSPDTTLSP